MIHLFRYAKRYRKEILLGPFFKFLEACFELLLPFFMARLIDQGIRKQDFLYVGKMAAWLFGLSVIGLLCVLICQYYAAVASQGFGTDLRNAVMKKINQFSLAEWHAFGSDTLITRVVNDIQQVQLALAMFIRLVIRAPFLSIGSVVMAFVIDQQIGWIFLFLLPIFCLILFVLIYFTMPLYQQVQKKLDALFRQVMQTLTGVRVIRVFAHTQKEEQQFAQATDALAQTYLRVSNLSALLTPMTTLMVNAGILFVLYMSGIKVSLGDLTQGEVLALINYMNQMLLALIVIANLVVLFTRALASADRIHEVLSVTPRLPNAWTPAADATVVSAASACALTFQDVTFHYPNAKGAALHGLSFAVAKHATFGIIGPTGSGKSTLAQLIPRFYDCSDGHLFVNEQDVRAWHLAALRQKIAWVPQTAVLFSGTIRENLRWGNPEATDAACLQALEIAQCLPFIRQLEAGLDAPVVEGGQNFSGGQKQRLAIARAIMKKPEILILDDALSALDFQTEQRLRQALHASLSQTTLIIISQRIRAIQSAEQILVLDQGRQVGLGTHAELMQTSKAYQEIAASQKEEHAS